MELHCFCRIFQSPVASSTAQSIGYFSLPPTIYTDDLNKLTTSLKCSGSLLLGNYAVVLGGGSKQSGALLDLLVSEYSTNFAAVQMSFSRVWSCVCVCLVRLTCVIVRVGEFCHWFSDARDHTSFAKLLGL